MGYEFRSRVLEAGESYNCLLQSSIQATHMLADLTPSLVSVTVNHVGVVACYLVCCVPLSLVHLVVPGGPCTVAHLKSP